VKTSALWITFAATAALLSGCAIPPTPYQPVGADRPGGLGYSSAKLDETLFRVSFIGNRRTSERAIHAYALYRCAEIAKEIKAPAFAILEGSVDRSVMDGDDKFATMDDRPINLDAFNVARLDGGAGPAC
jgi:hypothetical protein